MSASVSPARSALVAAWARNGLVVRLRRPNEWGNLSAARLTIVRERRHVMPVRAAPLTTVAKPDCGVERGRTYVVENQPVPREPAKLDQLRNLVLGIGGRLEQEQDELRPRNRPPVIPMAPTRGSSNASRGRLSNVRNMLSDRNWNQTTKMPNDVWQIRWAGADQPARNARKG